MLNILLFILTACASVDKPKPPALDLRTLDLSLEIPGFVYQWEACVRTGLFGKCREWEIKKELYDLRDPEIQKMLYNMNFVGRIREKPIPTK